MGAPLELVTIISDDMLYQHSIDSLRLYSIDGVPLAELITELQRLRVIARSKKLKAVRVSIGPRNLLGERKLTDPVDASLRLFVMGDK